MRHADSLAPAVTEIDYAVVDRYWEEASPSILGPYMMDGFGFPTSAGRFRFRAESRIVRRLLRGLKPASAVLDLGSGSGFWPEYFATRSARVVAVEGSRILYRALKRRCAPYANVHPVHANVMSFKPDRPYDLIFLGGLLMYLNETEVTALLRRLVPFLEPDGIILCRESTVRGNTVVRRGHYQVVYRSVATYQRIFEECGLGARQIVKNNPYVLMQMGCELVRKWKAVVPEQYWALSMVGRLTYYGLRLGSPWITYVARALGVPFPVLENHFFVLRARPS